MGCSLDLGGTGSTGGSDGADAMSMCGGVGASTWESASTLPALAGAGGGAYNAGGSAGLVILTYTPPSGGCLEIPDAGY
jgi:hypothetical protein